MKGHFGVDSRSKLIHAVEATPANVADSKVLPDLLHGNETRVWGDQAYRGQRAVIRQHAPRAKDFVNRRYRYRGVVDEVERAKNCTKSKVRAKVEHPIGIIKRVFGFAKVRYRGLKKNTHSLARDLRARICCAVTQRNLPRSATTDCRRHRCHANNETTAPTLSLIAAISMPDVHSQLLVQTFPRCHLSPTRGSRRRIRFANCWPNLRAHCRTVSWLTMMPRAASNSSTIRRPRGKRKYNHTAWPMISAGNRYPA